MADTVQTNLERIVALEAADVTLAADIAALATDLNTFYLIWAAVLVFFMQAGFGLLEAGSIRSKNVSNILFKNAVDASIGALMFWLVGYGLAYGGDLTSSTFRNPFIGTGEFALVSPRGQFTSGNYAGWLFQWSFAAAAATIVAGAVAERCQVFAYMLYSAIITGFIYPVVVHWVWSTAGWLSAFADGSQPRLGDNGMIDFAGSGVVHLTGGAAAFIGALIIGPRRGRFGPPGEDKEARNRRALAFRSHNTVYVALGVFILWVGWYGFNAGSTLAVSGGASFVAGRVAATTTLSATTACLTSLFLSRIVHGHLCIDSTLNGVLAGLVSITGPCSVVELWAAVIIGFCGAFVFFFFGLWLVKMRIDDPLNASGVHGACGIWGVLAVGLFAVPEYLNDAYGIANAQEFGLFYGGGWQQLAVQAIGALSIATWSATISGIIFGIMMLLKILRVSPEVEEAGLDITEHGGAAFDYLRTGDNAPPAGPERTVFDNDGNEKHLYGENPATGGAGGAGGPPAGQYMPGYGY